jgi:HK97 gp10 family phage protein
MKINFSLSLTGLETGKRDTEEKAKFVLWKCMNKMEEIAKTIVPVDTGRLKNSIHLIPMHSGARNYLLADGVDYGFHLEYGTYKMSPQPFFRPALHQVNYYWLDIFRKEVFGTA